MKIKIIIFLIGFLTLFLMYPNITLAADQCCFCTSNKGMKSTYYDIGSGIYQAPDIAACKLNKEVYYYEVQSGVDQGTKYRKYRPLSTGYTCTIKASKCSAININNKCGTAPCPTGEDCILNKCWKKISTENSEAECKLKAQSLPSFHYDAKTKACYLSGDALTKFGAQKDDWLKIYQEINPPKNTIHIPGLDLSALSSTVDNAGYIYMPWIGQYASAVYKFAMIAASLIAVLMIIIQGVTIMTGQGFATVEKWDAGSGTKQTKQMAYQKIGKIFIGLAIIWGSYTILYMINPALVEFKALKVKYVEQQDFPPIESSETINNTQPPVDLDSLNLVDIKGQNIYDKSITKAIPDLVEILQQAAKIIEAKGCHIVSANGARTSKNQLGKAGKKGWGVKARCTWSETYKTYINCNPAMGIWGSQLDHPLKGVPNKSGTCLYLNPDTPNDSRCNLNGWVHYNAIDAFASESKEKEGMCWKASCINHRCQRELIRAMTANGACVLLGRSKNPKGSAFEPWHFEIDKNKSWCFGKNADAIFNSLPGGKGI